MASDWRTQALIVAALELAHLSFESVRTDHALMLGGPLDWLLFKLDELGRSTFNVATALLALQGIERFGQARRLRRAMAVLAMVGAALAGAALGSVVLGEPAAVRVGASASTVVWFWYTLWTFSLVNLLALVAIDGLRRRQQAVNRLAAVQEHGRVVRQQLASAQLLAIQARVDPQLLFDMLAAVRGFYEHDAARAERLLDELSAFLRAALPRLRNERSTLEIECALVQSYVGLLRAAGTACIEIDVAFDRGLALTCLPAGVLLPLLAGPGRPGGPGGPGRPGASAGPAAQAGLAPEPRRITLVAHSRDDALCLRVTDSQQPDPATLQRLRASLAGLYGERGDLRLQARNSGAQVDLRVPLEHA